MDKSLKKLFFKLNGMNDHLLVYLDDKSNTLHSGEWDEFNELLDEAVNLTGDNHFQTLKVRAESSGSSRWILTRTLSMKVYQAVSYLYESTDNYLYDVDPPQKPYASGGGHNFTQTTALTQEQKNSQKQETTVNVEFNQTISFITEALVEAKQSFPEGTAERKFIDKLKEGIVLTKTTAELIQMIASTAAKYGIGPQILQQIFGQSVS